MRSEKLVIAEIRRAAPDKRTSRCASRRFGRAASSRSGMCRCDLAVPASRQQDNDRPIGRKLEFFDKTPCATATAARSAPADVRYRWSGRRGFRKTPSRTGKCTAAGRWSPAWSAPAPAARPRPAERSGTPPERRAASASWRVADGNPARRSAPPGPVFRWRSIAYSFRNSRQMRGICATTSTSPTTAMRPRIDHRSNARALHPRSRASEKLRVRMPGPQRLHHARSIQIARSFPGRNQNAH